ncbi:MAG: TonB-dependent receptor [Cyclobacteriaceae bacterium]|nr:TonB-dependent receptor [Cyclobacteriaceae bacterium]
MRNTIIFLLLSLSIYSNAQQITVIDNATHQTIEHVLVYSEANNLSVQTNAMGKADISIFEDKTIITFQHPAYQEFTIHIQEIAKLNYKIMLQEKVIQFEEVVIAAGKWEQNKNEVPNKILSISAHEIQTAQAQTVADLLQKTGQVFVQKSQLGGGSPSLRGFAANRVLIVVDGVRMNNAIFRSGNLQNIISIDPNVLQEAEVVFGPGSVIYGSDALGGVMDFHTLIPKFSNDTLLVKGNTMLRYSTVNQEKTGHFDIQLGNKKLAFLSSFSYSNYDDLRSGSKYHKDYGDFGKRYHYADRVNGQDILIPNEDVNLQKFTGFAQWSTLNKLRYKPTKNIELNYGLYHSNTSNFPRYDRLAQPSGNGLRNAEWYYGPQKWTMHRLEARLMTRNSFYNEAKIIASYQLFEESRHDRKFGNNSLRHQLENVNVITLNIDFDKNFLKSELFYGLEFTNNDVVSQAHREDIVSGEITDENSRYPDGGSHYSSFAGYLSYKYHLSKKLTSSIGARYNWVTLNGSSTNIDAIVNGFNKFDISNSTLSGSIGLAYLPINNTKIDFVASTGFRSPNIDDVGKVFEIDNDTNGIPIIVVPNPDLKSELSYNAEVGVSHRFLNKVKLNIVGYYTYLTNAIVRGSITINGNTAIEINGIMSELRAQINADEAYIYGGSANMNWELPYHLYLNSSFTITKGRDKTNNQPLRHTTPNFGKTTLGYKHDNFNIQFYSEYNGNRFRKDIPSTEIDDKSYLYGTHISDSKKDGIPEWATFNIKVYLEINKLLSISTAIENITDLHYRPYSSGLNAPGRNFIISLSAKIP